jgi:hypothetical protein
MEVVMKLYGFKALLIAGLLLFAGSSVEANPFKQGLKVAKTVVVVSALTAWAPYAYGYGAGFVGTSAADKRLHKLGDLRRKSGAFSTISLAIPPVYWVSSLANFSIDCYTEGHGKGVAHKKAFNVYATSSKEQIKKFFSVFKPGKVTIS